MTARATTGLIVIALGATLLTGCTTAPPPSPSSSPASPAPVAPSSAVPTPTPTADAGPPALADLVVGPNGLGQLEIGSPVDDSTPTTAVVAYKDDFCLANGKVGAPYVGQWLARYPKQSTSYGDGAPFTVLTNRGDKTGSVRFLAIWSTAIRTASGIAVDSTEAQVKAAYPTPTYVLKGNATKLFVIDKGAGRMIIEVADRVAYWPADERGKVLWILVQPATTKASSIAGTDGVGGCGE